MNVEDGRQVFDAGGRRGLGRHRGTRREGSPAGWARAATRRARAVARWAGDRDGLGVGLEWRARVGLVVAGEVIGKERWLWVVEDGGAGGK